MAVFERVTLNPVSEDPALQTLDLVGVDPSWGIYLLAHDYPPPEPETQHSSSADTEGDPVVQNRWGNRTISVRLRLFEPSDPAGTNLLTNPSVELNTTDWTADGTATQNAFERTSKWSRPGSQYSLYVKYTGTGAGQTARVWSKNSGGTAGFAVVAGTTYSFSAYVNVVTLPASGLGPQLYVRWLNAKGEVIEDSSEGGPARAIAAGETRLTLVRKAPVGAVSAHVMIGQYNQGNLLGNAEVTEFYVENAQLEASAAPTSYLDGDVPGCEWSSTRHGSSSSRPAPDGTRFGRIYADVTGLIDRIKREKYGFLRRKAPGFSPVVYDLAGAKVIEAPQDLGIGMRRAEIALAFEADPGGRGPEVQIGGNFDELVKPALVFLAEGVPGEMPALGRMVVTDLQGKVQEDAWWGQRQAYYDSSANAELFYEMETRTGITLAAAEMAGASGAGKNALKGRIRRAWSALASTQAAGGGAHLQHVGSYRFLIRVFRTAENTGEELALMLQWAQGDFAHPILNENDAVYFTRDDREGQWTIEDLGIVTIDRPPSGTTPRWEGRVLGRVLGKGGQLDEIGIDWMMLVPVDEGSGELHASTAIPTAEALTCLQSEPPGGALTPTNEEMGTATWSAILNSDPDDFVGNAEGWIQRTAVSDAGTIGAPLGAGRGVGFSGIAMSDIAAAMQFKVSAGNTGFENGMLLRFVDVKNYVYLQIGYDGSSTSTYYTLYVVNEGVKKELGLKTDLNKSPKNWQRLVVECVGEVIRVWAGPVGSEKLLISAAHESLAPGKKLEKGGWFIYDYWTAAGALTRYYKQIEIWKPSFDAAMFPSKSFELRSDRIRRQDVAGVTWGRVPYEGDYLLVPQQGPEKRPTQVIVKGSRDRRFDAGIDDLRAQMFVTPRYLNAPPT